MDDPAGSPTRAGPGRSLHCYRQPRLLHGRQAAAQGQVRDDVAVLRGDPDECRNYFRHYGYGGATRSQNAL